MIKIKMLAASILAAGLLFGSQSAQAHCDSIDGPVAKAALAALDTGNVNLRCPMLRQRPKARSRPRSHSR